MYVTFQCTINKTIKNVFYKILVYSVFFPILALVDKIYHAQKERDDAMNARLRLARDEKDELINRLRRLEKEQSG